METEKHYFKVGFFFVSVIGALIYYLVTFGSAKDIHLVRHAIFFEHSVSGLSRGSTVKLKGIEVGLVEEIRFSSIKPGFIRVLVDIVDNAPVRVDTVATLAFQGITGTSYISLENKNPDQPAGAILKKEGDEYPVIESEQSNLEAVLSSAPDVMRQLGVAAENAQRLMPSIQEALTEAKAALREFKMLARTIREDPSVIIRGSKYDGFAAEKK